MRQTTTTRLAPLPSGTVFACTALFVGALATSPLTSSQAFSVYSASSPQSNAQSANSQTDPPTTETISREGPFAIADQQFTLRLHHKAILTNTAAPPSAANFTSTLSHLEILNDQGNSVYQESFQYPISQQHFSRTLSASASLLPGTGGVALVIRFLEHTAATSEAAQAEPVSVKESWQVFGLVNGQLVPFGAVLPLGRGTDITVGGALSAVMIKGGIEVMPMASTAEVLAFRAWTGSFYANIPVRVDWAHGKWGEGEQCYALDNGSLRERGCLMKLDAAPVPPSPDADTAYIRLFQTPDPSSDNSVNVAVSSDSHPEFSDMLAIVQWEDRGRRVECSFRNVWLYVHLDGKEGWVHGQDAFNALGLPLRNPQ